LTTEVSGISAIDLQEVALALGDDCLVLSHRLAEWTTHAPELEEEVALANLALDLLGQARSLLSLAGEAEGRGRDEDQLAYWRDDRDFRNLLLVEQPNGDFAVTMTRQLLFSAYQELLYDRMSLGTEPRLAAIAAKGVMEARYHLEHARLWVQRMGGGTEESHGRMRRALDLLWPFTNELFEPTEAWDRVADQGALPPLSSIEGPWRKTIQSQLESSHLETPEFSAWQSGGRRGSHSEHLGHLLAEMQHLHRSHPNATW
jgi:ring-1,2-phenylacetyl-CoA epoxidase subunit PaaC